MVCDQGDLYCVFFSGFQCSIHLLLFACLFVVHSSCLLFFFFTFHPFFLHILPNSPIFLHHYLLGRPLLSSLLPATFYFSFRGSSLIDPIDLHCRQTFFGSQQLGLEFYFSFLMQNPVSFDFISGSVKPETVLLVWGTENSAWSVWPQSAALL